VTTDESNFNAATALQNTATLALGASAPNTVLNALF
jgi:hypothetical protein